MIYLLKQIILLEECFMPLEYQVSLYQKDKVLNVTYWYYYNLILYYLCIYNQKRYNILITYRKNKRKKIYMDESIKSIIEDVRKKKNNTIRKSTLFIRIKYNHEFISNELKNKLLQHDDNDKIVDIIKFYKMEELKVLEIYDKDRYTIYEASLDTIKIKDLLI